MNHGPWLDSIWWGFEICEILPGPKQNSFLGLKGPKNNIGIHDFALSWTDYVISGHEVHEGQKLKSQVFLQTLPILDFFESNDQKIFNENYFWFFGIFFAQNEPQIVLNMMGERKRTFYSRINEFENPTKFNLNMYILYVHHIMHIICICVTSTCTWYM